MPLDANAPESYEVQLPAAIKRQVAATEELVRQAYPESTTVVEGNEPAAAAPVETSPAPAPAPAAPVVDWEHKFNTLQGKYNAEIGQVSQLRAHVASLERTIEQLAQRPAEPVKPEPKTTTVVEGPSDKDKEEYGEDLINAVQRFVAPILAQRDARIAELEGRVQTTAQTAQQVQQTSLQQAAMASLDADPEMGRRVEVNGQHYAHWRVVNEDPKFVAWLQQADPVFGAPRLGVLRTAFDKGNAAQMKAIFGAYAREQTVVEAPHASPATHTEAPAGQPAASTGRVPLETFAAPGRPSGSAPVGAPGEKRIWSQKEIADFYRKSATGGFNNDLALKARLEADIVAAAIEGRVRQR